MIAIEYIQQGYNIFRQTSLENLPFFVMKKQKKMVLSVTIIQPMKQIQPVLELSHVETRCSSIYDNNKIVK